MTAPMDLRVTGSEDLAARLILVIAGDDRAWWGHVIYRDRSHPQHQPMTSGFIRPSRVDHGQGTAIEVVHCDGADDIGVSDYTLVAVDDIISVTIPC